MAQVSAPLDMANLALGHLKHKAITSINPPDKDSKGAKAAAKWYDTIRRSALADHPWNFACKRATIAAEADAPIFEWSTKFEQPDDYIRLVKVGEVWWSDFDYEDEDGYILTNEPGPLYLKYIYDQKDLTKWSPKFVLYMSLHYASAMAYEVTGNASLGEGLKKEAEKILQVGQSIDGQNRPPRRIERIGMIAARRGRGGRYRGWERWGDN